MWTCLKCREQIADALVNCWNCGVDRNGSPMSDVDKELNRAMGRKELYIDTRQGLFFCVMGGLSGSIFFYLVHPKPPTALSEIITKINLASAANKGISQILSTLTKDPNCYILSGLIIFGIIGLIVDKMIGNGNSLLCKISHFISCSDMDKPVAKLLIAKGMSRYRVEGRIGNPVQIVKKGTAEIYIYKYIKITFENDRVSTFE